MFDSRCRGTERGVACTYYSLLAACKAGGKWRSKLEKVTQLSPNPTQPLLDRVYF